MECHDDDTHLDRTQVLLHPAPSDSATTTPVPSGTRWSTAGPQLIVRCAHRHRRGRPRSATPASTRPRDRCPLRRPQRARARGAGRRPDDRPDPDGRRHASTRVRRRRLGARRRPARRARPGGAAARPGDHGRQRLAHRRRRPDPRRRHGLAGPATRAGLRQRRLLSRWSPPTARCHREPQEHPELFWGLRGGGGNFGIVTEFEFRLHRDRQADPRRRLQLRNRGRGPGIAGLARLADATLRGRPPSPRRSPTAMPPSAWCGSAIRTPDVGCCRHSSRWVARCAQLVQQLSYLELQTRDDTVGAHAWRRYAKGHYLKSFSDDAIDAFLRRGSTDGTGDNLPGVGLQAYGGAIGDIPDGDTAFSHRDTLFEWGGGVRWTDPAEDSDRMAAARAAGAAMAPYADGVYVNSISDEGAAGVRRAYSPSKLAKLRALKDGLRPVERLSPQRQHQSGRALAHPADHQPRKGSSCPKSSSSSRGRRRRGRCALAKLAVNSDGYGRRRPPLSHAPEMFDAESAPCPLTPQGDGCLDQSQPGLTRPSRGSG